MTTQQFLEQKISEVTESTWQAMLGLELKARRSPAGLKLTEEFLTGRVEISGAWNGVVLVHGSIPLTQVAASIMFANDESGVTKQDQMDVMYELTNLIGGGIKSLFPESCQLSLPSVHGMTPELLTVFGAEQVSELVFNCQGQPLLVSVWKREDG